MTLEQKQFIAATARNLIFWLENCGDEEFVNLVTECIASADPVPLEVEYL